MLGKTTRWLASAAVVLLVGVAAACGSSDGEQRDGEAPPATVGQQVETAGGVYTGVSPQELSSMLTGKDLLLVNVHVPYEGEIEGTDLFIPYDEIGDRLGELPSQTDAKIVVYCRSGGMSAIAASTLVGAGYTNVWNLAGGMIAWEEAGYPLVNEQP